MINVKTDWKIITLWIGGNDLCKYCYTDKSKGGTTAQEYHDAIKESLDYLKANVKTTRPLTCNTCTVLFYLASEDVR